jgi:Endonuclease/Exonuclease/phosphatase family
MIRLLSWNMAHRSLWSHLDGFDADLALLQEAPPPPSDHTIELHPLGLDSWATAGYSPRQWRTAIARLSERVELTPRTNVAIHAATGPADWTISHPGCVTAADVNVSGSTLFTVVSVYATWEMSANRGFADASAHRILSDLSVLMGTGRHRLLIAGDWNILRGYGEYGNAYFRGRYATVFDRAEALGLRCVGPEYPNGRRADPWPDELPADSLCVPTFHHSQQTPATATRQLDFVFASRSLADAVMVRALNEIADWGPSDHSRLLIDVDL